MTDLQCLKCQSSSQGALFGLQTSLQTLAELLTEQLPWLQEHTFLKQQLASLSTQHAALLEQRAAACVEASKTADLQADLAKAQVRASQAADKLISLHELCRQGTALSGKELCLQRDGHVNVSTSSFSPFSAPQLLVIHAQTSPPQIQNMHVVHKCREASHRGCRQCQSSS